MHKVEIIIKGENVSAIKKILEKINEDKILEICPYAKICIEVRG